MEEFLKGDTIELINPYWRSKRFIVSTEVYHTLTKDMKTIKETKYTIVSLNLYNQIRTNYVSNLYNTLKILTCRMVLTEKRNKKLNLYFDFE